MRVGGVSSSMAAQIRKAEKSQASGFALPASEAGNASQTSASSRTAPTSNIAMMQSILALQSVPDPLERKRRAQKRANNILDELEELKMEILSGTISPQRLGKLTQLLNATKEEIDDEYLKAIIEDIELRAEVELAKIEMSNK